MRRMRLTALALTEAVKARALELGFDRVAVRPAEAISHAEAFERGLDAGYGEGMEWIGETRAERLEPGRLQPSLQPARGRGRPHRAPLAHPRHDGGSPR